MGKLAYKTSIFLLFAALSSCHNPSKSQTYTIGLDPTWYPLQASGIEKNILAFSIEVLTEIAKREHLELAVVQMNWDNLLLGLQNHKYAGVLSTLRPYSFYQKTYSFSQPYLMTGPALIVPKGSHIKSLKDLKGKEIGVVRGSSSALILQTTPGILMQGYDSIAQTLAALNDLQIEAALVDILIGQDFVRNLYPNRLEVATCCLNNEGLRLLTLYTENELLIKRFDSGLEKLKKSGDYDKLLKKWGLAPDGGNTIRKK